MNRGQDETDLKAIRTTNKKGVGEGIKGRRVGGRKENFVHLEENSTPNKAREPSSIKAASTFTLADAAETKTRSHLQQREPLGYTRHATPINNTAYYYYYYSTTTYQ